MTMNRLFILLIVVLLVFGFVFYLFPLRKEKLQNGVPVPSVHLIEFSSSTLGLGFKYPSNYFMETKDLSTPSRKHTRITLTEDTEVNRGVDGGSIFKGTEGPVRIYINVYQNDKLHERAEDWIKNNPDSDYKLSDGKLNRIFIDGQPAVQYNWSGLYEADGVVVATDSFLYSFAVTHITPADQIREDFNQLLNSISFTQ